MPLGLGLPEELEVCCGNFMDAPSAARFAQTGRAGDRAVRLRLKALKKKYDDAKAKEAAAEAARPRRITLSAAGGAFIDTYVNMYISADPAQRNALCEHILEHAAMFHESFRSTDWTVQTVKNRLKNHAHRVRTGAA